MTEIWRDIEGYENLYKVSNLGRVKSLNYRRMGKEKILKASKDKDGYLIVGLCKDSKSKNYKVHRIVALAFIPNPDNLQQVNHIDEDKTNNIVSNLEWCNQKYNNNYGTHKQRISESNRNHPKKSKLVLCIETGKIYPSAYQIQRELGFLRCNISAVCRGIQKTCGGFHWRYID